ncbi:MAG: nicotinamide mononucleotide transporter [Bacteroidales bacterium]|nr:nicotinamide mononucleotide transporter [Bacteroidales bacterium]
MNYLEIAGVIIGLLYLYLEYHANVWLWIVGVIMPTIYIFVYYDAGLYADMWISVYYILASVYGLIVWMRRRATSGEHKEEGADNHSNPAITSMPRKYYLWIGLIIVVLTLSIGTLLSRLTDSTVPWADGFTTALSVVAMWMLAKKYTQQWLMWIAADIACALLYLYKDLWFTSGLYLLYTIIAYFGYKRWRKLCLR